MANSFKQIVVTLLLMVSVEAFGQMPPHPDLLKKIASGEVAEPYMMQHWEELRAQGIYAPSPSAIYELLTKKRLEKSAGISSNSSDAITYNILAVCVDFTDRPFVTSPAYFDNLFLSTTKSNSLYSYLNEVTYGKIHVTMPKKPSEIGLVMAAKTYAYYCGTTHGEHVGGELIGEIARKIDPVVDYSLYDNDGNGSVDCFFVIHSGPGAELTGKDTDIWSHASSINYKTGEGVYVKGYSTEPEYWTNSGDMAVGVYAHEMGHAAFGLPDMYDTEDDKDNSQGLGNWSIMAGGSWGGNGGDWPPHYDPWCKIKMGVITPTVITEDQVGLVIDNIEKNPVIYKVWKDGSSTSTEYFLLENKQKIGFDSKLPTSGLCIYHVDDNRSSNGKAWYPGHTSTGHYHVALEQADGFWDLEQGNNGGDNKDPFPGVLNKRTFNYASVPNSRSYGNSFTNIAIKNIIESAGKIIADVSLSDAFNLSATSIDLGSVEASGSLGASSLSIKNTGSVPIMISEITNLNPRIKLDSPYEFPHELLQNESFNLKVIFTPTERGTVNDTIRISYTGKNTDVIAIPVTAFGFIVNAVSDNLVYCSTRQGYLLSIDLASGAAKMVGKTGFPRVRSLTISRKDKMLYGLGITSTEADLIKINARGGDGYKLVKLDKPVTAIAMDASEEIFGVSDLGQLYKINTASGVCALIGNTGFTADSGSLVSGLAVNPVTDELYASIGSGSINMDAIYKIDKTSGAPTLVGNTGFNMFTTCIAFDNTGNLFGMKKTSSGNENLIKIDPSTGVGTLQNSSSFTSIEGMATVNNVFTDVEDSKASVVTFALEQNYPNPFNPSTSINYSLPKSGFVKLKVFDMLGREVATLVNEVKNTGHHSVSFNAAQLSSGVYFYTMKTDNFSSIKKMILVK